MEDKLIIVIVILLALLIIVKVNSVKTTKKIETQNELQNQLQEKNNHLHSLQHELKQNVELLERQHIQQIQSIEQKHSVSLRKKEEELALLNRYSVNRGEMITEASLKNFKEKLVSAGEIKNDEMIILGNLFIPCEEDGKQQIRQIDHILLTRNQVYLIETKYWRNLILHGATKDNLGALWQVLNNLCPEIRSNEKKSLVFSASPYKDIPELKLRVYDNPEKQVRTTAVRLKEFLSEKNPKFNLVKTIVYYSYPNGKTNCTINLNPNTESEGNLSTKIITNEADLLNHIKSELQNSQFKYSPEDLIEIRDILYTFNKLNNGK